MPPYRLRELVEVVERLTRSEGQPVDPKELEQLGLVVMDCVADGLPLQVAVLASVDIMNILEDVNADDLDGPLAPFLRLRRAGTAHEEVSGDTGANTNGDVVLDDIIAPSFAVALLRVAALEEMQAKANDVETAAVAAERLVEDFEEALQTAREAVTEVSRMYDRVEAVRPKVNGITASADSENTWERPLGAVPRLLEPRLLQTVNDAALKVARARAKRLEALQPLCGSPLLESFLREENNRDSKHKKELLDNSYSVELLSVVHSVEELQ